MTLDARQSALAKFIESAFQRIDSADNYYLLGVGRDAPEAEIRAAYYRLAGKLHPDLHGPWMPEDLRLKLNTVYSRVVEAYKVLTHGAQREQYDRGLSEGKVRWDANQAAKPKKIARPEEKVENPGARKFFLLGHNALLAGNAKAAIMNLELALSMEPNNPIITSDYEKAKMLTV